MNIYKYPLELKQKQDICLPRGAEILCLKNQRDIPTIWVKVAEHNPDVWLPIFMYTTGEECNAPTKNYLGTFISANGNFVGHFFLGE
jgi:hypothetical protein